MTTEPNKVRRGLLEAAIRNQQLIAALSDPNGPHKALVVADTNDTQGRGFVSALGRDPNTPPSIREACLHSLAMNAVMFVDVPINLMLQITRRSASTVAECVRNSGRKKMIPAVVFAANGAMTCSLATPRQLAETN